MRFLPCPPPARKNILIQTLCGWCMPKLTKIDQNKFTLPQLSHLSSNRRVHNLPLYFQFTTPARELTHRTKFVLPRKTRISETPCFFTTWGQRNAKNPTQKDTNFGNAMFLYYLRPEKCQNPTQKDTNFGNAIILCYLEPENHQIQPWKTRISHKTALIDPSKNAKESIHFSRISHIVLKCTH